MSDVRSAVYLRELTATLAAQLGSGDADPAQWSQLHALLWVAGRERLAARLAALCQPSLDDSADSADSADSGSERGLLLAELADQCALPALAHTGVSMALRHSLVAFYQQPSAPWQPPLGLDQLPPTPAGLAAQLCALAPHSAELFARSSAERSHLVQLLACLDQQLAGTRAQPLTAQLEAALAAWQAEWQLPSAPLAGADRRAIAALAEVAVQELEVLVGQLDSAGRGLVEPFRGSAGPFAASQVGHLAAVFTVLAPQLVGLSFAPSQMLTYIELGGSLEPWQRQQLMAMLAELETLLLGYSRAAAGPFVSAQQALGYRARRQLVEQVGVSIIGIERLLDHHQLHAIDADLCEQLQRQLLQLAAALEVLAEPQFSAALQRLAAQLSARREAVDHRIKRGELETLTELLVALEALLGRQFNGEVWPLAALSPTATDQLRQRAEGVAKHGWQRVE